jgi:hypothetical protein
MRPRWADAAKLTVVGAWVTVCRVMSEVRTTSRTRKSRPGAILFVHGLRVWRDPLAGWPRACATVVARSGARPLVFTYPQWAGWSAFAWPSGPVAQGLARRLARECADLATQHGSLAVIAHSFGCVLIAHALEQRPPIDLCGLVLFGSILPESFSWNTLVLRDQIPAGRIRNELGPHGPPIRWAARLQPFGLPYGASGVKGFGSGADELGVDHRYPSPDVTLSTLTRHCEDVWLPFLGLRRRHSTARRGPSRRWSGGSPN